MSDVTTRNPATGEDLTTYELHTDAQVAEIVEAAHAAFDGWRRESLQSRAETVRHGLQALRTAGAAEEDWVLVHDAARCLVEPAWVQRLIEACREDPVGGLLALPLTQRRAYAGDGDDDHGHDHGHEHEGEGEADHHHEGTDPLLGEKVDGN